jgi:mRNA-degrading endonuclease RelE of RelBE toxin-antitoxin system
VARLLELGDDPHPSGRRVLAASGKYRLRIGRHRVLYTVTRGDTDVVIVAILEETRGGR